MRTLDETIEHCLEQSEIDGICDCMAEHRQLADWLVRLKRLEKSHLNMHELKNLAVLIHDIIEKHLGTLDVEKSNLVYNEIVDLLETRLDPDDYPDSSYN